jgi:hypothetical protein
MYIVPRTSIDYPTFDKFMKVKYDPSKATTVSQLEKRKNLKYHMAILLIEQALINMPFVMHTYYGKLSDVD